MISANLSMLNFSTANYSKNGLYFSSVLDVLFEVKPKGCRRFTTFPLGRMWLKFWVKMALNASWHPSVVMMNGVPSHLGPCRTGSDVIAALRSRKALECSWVHLSANTWLAIIH